MDTTIEQRLDAVLEEAYQAFGIYIRPMFPWVLVRLCRKEQKIGGVWLPDSIQNKTLHEGIVLCTWQPCQRIQNGYTLDLSSELSRGDRVLFHHFAGVPLEGRGSGYRLVKEVAWAVDKEGGIIAAVEGGELHTRPFETLRSILADPHTSVHEALRRIDEHFILVDRNATAVTLSGR
jgi:co-chaperonin GroES (HSP10)